MVDGDVEIIFELSSHLDPGHEGVVDEPLVHVFKMFGLELVDDGVTGTMSWFDVTGFSLKVDVVLHRPLGDAKAFSQRLVGAFAVLIGVDDPPSEVFAV